MAQARGAPAAAAPTPTDREQQQPNNRGTTQNSSVAVAVRWLDARGELAIGDVVRVTLAELDEDQMDERHPELGGMQLRVGVDRRHRRRGAAGEL